MQGSKIGVLIVDDSLMIRDSLQQMISGEPDMLVVGTAKDGLEALGITRRQRPDVILMDLNMPLYNGRNAIPQIKSRFPAQKILVFTVCDSIYEIWQVLRQGAQGYISKSSSIYDILNAIRRIANNEAVIPAKIGMLLIEEFRSQYQANFELTPLEIRIMNLAGDGLGSAEIAYRTLIGEKEVNRTLRRFLEIIQTELRAEVEDAGRLRGTN